MNARGRAWSEHAHRQLAARGHRAGGARMAVIDGLAASAGCVTARRLAADLNTGGQRVGVASVYRALGALEDAGLVRHMDLGNSERRWELVYEDGAHHHHVVCDRCGRTVAFTDPLLEREIEHVAIRLGVTVAAHDVVLHGTCVGCGPGASGD